MSVKPPCFNFAINKCEAYDNLKSKLTAQQNHNKHAYTNTFLTNVKKHKNNN